MPFKSKAQQRWMFANKPKLAKEFAKHTRNFDKLPEKIIKQAGVLFKKLFPYR